MSRIPSIMEQRQDALTRDEMVANARNEGTGQSDSGIESHARHRGPRIDPGLAHHCPLAMFQGPLSTGTVNPAKTSQPSPRRLGFFCIFPNRRQGYRPDRTGRLSSARSGAVNFS